MELQYCIVVCNFDFQPNLKQLVRVMLKETGSVFDCASQWCYCSQLVGCGFVHFCNVSFFLLAMGGCEESIVKVGEWKCVYSAKLGYTFQDPLILKL
jgi:hypothetical protein